MNYFEFYTLVFVKNDRVVCHFTAYKNEFDFDEELKKGEEIKASVFRVSNDGNPILVEVKKAKTPTA
ncbi:MAG: hypothetical protein ACOX15_07350 [Tepidanaerobacteraceae bacterium]